MPPDPAFEDRLIRYVDENISRLTSLVADLVRIPSENTPPAGAEFECQQFVAGRLRAAGWDPLVYTLDSVPGLRQHPLFWSGRDYSHRPNVGARKAGANGGRSLVLSGHMDTVPRGTQNWTRDPFGGAVEGNRLYGRGSNDMKGGVATNLFVIEALAALGIRLCGDLVFETVVDEEFGGVNGTLAGRLMGFNADGAIISEPSFLRVCAGQRGGRTVHITFRSSGGVLTDAGFPAGVIQQLTHFLSRLPDFARQRRERVKIHELYSASIDPVPVAVTKIFTAPWGTREPITVPEECKLELYWQAMPGETQSDIEREFLEWFESMIAMAPDLFATRPSLEFPIRWLPGSAIDKLEPLIAELSAVAASVLGRDAVIAGIEGPCDLYVFHQSQIPAVLWGGRGANTHGADEYVEIDSLVQAAKALLIFVCRWCGVDNQAVR
jgi:acetylornithine deacetylase